MLKIIFTLDYEIHGNGDGCPYKLMVEPTYRLIKLMDRYGAKLTIFADMAEIIKFKEYLQNYNEDKFHYLKIKEQLQQAVLLGHDVQLHIHSSYSKAKFEKKKWQQNWPDYNLAELDYETIYTRVKQSKELLEEIIWEKLPSYKCYAFRAANWSMHPTENIAKALLANDIYIDSSVYKYGKQSGWVNYDYSNAFSSTFPYKASINNICEYDSENLLWEFPIYSELKPIFNFISLIRLFRIIRASFHKHKQQKDYSKVKTKTLSRIKNINKFYGFFSAKYPLKFDFNQLSGAQMIKYIKNIGKDSNNGYVTLIGHSKSFIKYNTYTLTKFLKFLARDKRKYVFSLFPENPEL